MKKKNKRNFNFKKCIQFLSKSTLRFPLYSILLGSLVAGASERYVNHSIIKEMEAFPKAAQKITKLLEKQKLLLAKENPLSIIYKNGRKEPVRTPIISELNAVPLLSKALSKINSRDVASHTKGTAGYLLSTVTPKKTPLREDKIRVAVSSIERETSKQPLKHFVTIKGLINFPIDMPPESGHFEVGFYEGISRVGEPIGPPIVQSILTHGKVDFALDIPFGAEGYLFAFYSGDEYSKSWFGYPEKLFSHTGVKEIYVQIPIGDGLAIAAANLNNKKILQGRVNKMFYSEEEGPSLNAVMVRIRGTKISTQTNSRGQFELPIPNIKGSILLEFLKLGYSPRVEKVSIVQNTKVFSLAKPMELMRVENIHKMATLVGVKQDLNRSILIVKSTGKDRSAGLPGISMQLSLEAEGPYYFSEKGELDNRMESTSFDGRAVFFNVKKGVGFLESFILGEDTVPTIISSLGNMELIHKNLSFSNQKIHGKLLNPIKLTKEGVPSPIIGARVKISGSSQWTETDLFGYFELPNSFYVRGSKIILEFSTANYYKHRYQLEVPDVDTKKLNSITLYAFPIDYINNMANSVNIKLNPNTGIIIGQASKGKSLQINTLLDHSTTNESMDFYFDKNQNIQNSHAFTNRKYGTYAVFNIAAGRGVIQGHDRSGTLSYADVLHLSPSTVTVLTSK